MGMVTGTSPACQESRVWVRVWVRGYRYKLLYPDKYHEYGYNGQGYYKSAELSPLQLYLKNLATGLSEGRLCRISVTSNTGTPVVHTK